MNEQQERSAFERWYEGHCLPGEADWFRRDPDEPDEYKHGHTSEAWAGWQAGRAALAANVPASVKQTIGLLLNDAMSQAVSNGANSISMPDEYVELAAWLADAAAPAPEAKPEAQQAEKLLRDALPHAEWREKRIHVCGGPVLQHWLLEVYLPIPAESGMRPEQALERALGIGASREK